MWAAVVGLGSAAPTSGQMTAAAGRQPLRRSSSLFPVSAASSSPSFSRRRMLLCVRERFVSDSHNHSSLQRQFSHGHSQKFEDGGSGSGTRISHFLPTSRRIVQFSNGKGPGPDARIVYIDGAFDLFHARHVEILKLARELGDFLLVGIHTD